MNQERLLHVEALMHAIMTGDKEQAARMQRWLDKDDVRRGRITIEPTTERVYYEPRDEGKRAHS